MTKKRILVLDHRHSSYADPFEDYGDILFSKDYPAGMNLVKEIQPDLVVFVGGTDVDPSLYGEVRQVNTDVPAVERDTYESLIYSRCVDEGIPMVGICRGAQFLCVMNGGKLVQHLTGHTGAQHRIFLGTSVQWDNKYDILVNTLHHQMMVPRGDFNLLAWTRAISPDLYKQGFPELVGGKEPEVVWWKNTKSLGVQYHPEMMNPQSEGWKFFQYLLESYFFTDAKEVAA